MQRPACLLIAWALAVSLAFAAAGAALPIPGIVGTDDRLPVTVNEHPWTAIGRLNNTLGPFCTGVLVGPRQVLTAAHCLWNPRAGTWLPPCSLHFLAGYQRGNYLAHSLVVDYQIQGRYELDQLQKPPGPGQDWAILTLAKDLRDVATILPTAPLDNELLISYQKQGGFFLQAGYSRDRPHILTQHNNCRLKSFQSQGRLVFHECDATFGDSGSPILLRRGNSYHLVAIHVAIDQKHGLGIAVTGTAFHERMQALEPPPPINQEIKACQLPADGFKTVTS